MQSGFFKNHADTLAIIAVNLTIFAVLISMCLGNSVRTDAANARSDQLYTMFIDLVKEGRK